MKRNNLKVLQPLQVELSLDSPSLHSLQDSETENEKLLMLPCAICLRLKETWFVHTTNLLDNAPTTRCSVKKRIHILQRSEEQGTDTVGEV
jgi:hypothetical protein